MFITMVDANVTDRMVRTLLDAWAEETRGPTPEGLLETYLMHQSSQWRIVTVWDSRDAVMAMREQGRPAAVTMFERAGAKPNVTMWSVEGYLELGGAA